MARLNRMELPCRTGGRWEKSDFPKILFPVAFFGMMCYNNHKRTIDNQKLYDDVLKQGAVLFADNYKA